MRLTRRTALAVAAVIAVPALAACQPNQAGTAASVGDARITTTDLSARVARSLTDKDAKAKFTDKADFQRRVLTLMIDHELIAAEAKKEGVSVSSGDVAARLKTFTDQAGGRPALEKQASAAGIAAKDLDPYIRDLVLTEKVGDKLIANTPVPQAQLEQAYQAQYTKVHAAHILVKAKALADSLLAQVRAKPATFAALAKKYSTDTGSKASGGDLGTQAPSQYVAPFAAAVTSAPVGSVVEVQTQFGWHVIKVISRTASKPLAEVQDQLRGTILAQQRQAATSKALAARSKTLGVKVNPRFGKWDATAGTVVAAKDDTVKTSDSPTPQPSAS